MSSNMDTVTNVDTANILSNYGWISVFPKHFNKDWENEKNLPEVLKKTNTYALSCGTSDADIQSIMRTTAQIERVTGQRVKMICVDIANGYLDALVQKCCKIRE